METLKENVITVYKDGILKAVIHSDMKKRAQVFFSVSEMGADEIKDLLGGE